MNSKEMREYIQAIKRRYEARKSEIRILSSTDNQSVANSETRRQICLLPDSQLVANSETRLQNCILPDNQSVANGETERQICLSTDFQPVRVVHGGSEDEHGTLGI